jgi:hypothetical protein
MPHKNLLFARTTKIGEPVLDLNYDQFLEEIGHKGFRVFVLLLEQEYQHLSQGDSWLQHFEYPTSVVRLTKDDFVALDVGVHPTVLIYHDGGEVGQFNGIPKAAEIKAAIRRKQHGTSQNNS